MNDERFEFRLPQDLIARIDRWREGQPTHPSRAAAIRYLLQSRLDAITKQTRRQLSRQSTP